MSISLSGSIDTNKLLPNLPGYRVKEAPNGIKKQHFLMINGEKFIKDDVLPSISAGTATFADDASVNTSAYSTAMTSFSNKPKSRPGLSSAPDVYTFHAYFVEVSSYSKAPIDETRVRKCNIHYYIESGMITIIEKPQLNSGMPQGTLVNRSVVLRTDGVPFTPEDFVIGDSVEIFGREYHIVDCDNFTKQRLEIDSQKALVPKDLYNEYRKTLEKGPSDDWMKYRSKKNQNKAFMEASLGKGVDNKGREGYMRFGNQSLKFKCLWDNTSMLYGDLVEFVLNYYLSDDTIEIYSSKGQFMKLLKRSKLPKQIGHMFLGEGDVKPDHYHWTDFYIGLELNVYARKLKIVDADSTTRDFFNQNYDSLDLPVELPEPVVHIHQREIPPPTGYGSEEDSLRSCSGPLLSGPSKQKKQGESKTLSFLASILSGGPDDIDRRFVVTYYLQDETLKVHEPPVRNSGFVGGVFLSRRPVKNANGDPISEDQLYLGSKLQILKHMFLLIESNEGTLRWMEDKRLPRASFYDIVDKMRPALLAHARSGALKSRFESMEMESTSTETGPGPQGRGRATKEMLAEVLSYYNLVGEDSSQLVEHELVTIVRANGNKLKSFNYEKVIEQIISPTDEFK